MSPRIYLPFIYVINLNHSELPYFHICQSSYFCNGRIYWISTIHHLLLISFSSYFYDDTRSNTATSKKSGKKTDRVPDDDTGVAATQSPAKQPHKKKRKTGASSKIVSNPDNAEANAGDDNPPAMNISNDQSVKAGRKVPEVNSPRRPGFHGIMENYLEGYMSDDPVVGSQQPKVQKSGTKKFDIPHDPSLPPMNQFTEYETGNDIALIWDVTGMKLADKSGRVLKSAEFHNSPNTSYPHSARMSRLLPLDESPPPPFQNMPCIGHFPHNEFHPWGAIFKAKKYLDVNARQPKWSSVPDVRFVASPALLAGCMALMPDLLLQAPYQIDITEELGEDDPHAISQGPWYTRTPMMIDFLKSNQDLEQPLDERECNLRNKTNWRNWNEIVAVQLLANSAFIPQVFPKALFAFPQDELERFADQHLTHFHCAEIPNEAPQLTDKRRMFRQRVRQKPKLAHYLAYKRALTLIKPKITELFRGGHNSEVAHVKNLIPTDDTFTSLPALSHDRVFKTLTRKIFKHGVYSDFPSWHENQRLGIFVVEFFFWWGFGGASYVSTLPLAQRMQWKRTVLRGDSAKELGWLVTSTRMDELEYPVEFPQGRQAPVVLRIHETSDDVMKILKRDGKSSLMRAHHLILDSRKNTQGKYTIGKPLWTPTGGDADVESGDGEDVP